MRHIANREQRLLKEIKELKSALQIIHTWATFANGIALDTEHVAKLCDKVLKTEVKHD